MAAALRAGQVDARQIPTRAGMEKLQHGMLPHEHRIRSLPRDQRLQLGMLHRVLPTHTRRVEKPQLGTPVQGHPIHIKTVEKPLHGVLRGRQTLTPQTTIVLDGAEDGAEALRKPPGAIRHLSGQPKRMIG
jgi:hypothetical protein